MNSAFITGAGGDIGQATIKRLLQDGWRVAATDIAVEQLCEYSGHPNVMVMQCDITSISSVEQATSQAVSHFGAIDLLVNNAGGITAPSLRTVTEADWQRDLDLNLTGHWRCIRALQDQMIDRGRGIIVNVASVNGLGIFGHPGYSAAKAGLIHLTKFLAVEFGKYGIRSIAICPGSVRTQAWNQRAEHNPEVLDEVMKWYPSRKICSPQDVANAIAAATSDHLSMLNGAVIALDGGLSSGTDQVASLFTGTTI